MIETYAFVANNYPNNEAEEETQDLLEKIEEIAVRRYELFKEKGRSTLGEDLLQDLLDDDYDELLTVAAVIMQKLLRWDRAENVAEGSVA